ncbi:hypothetical protein M0R04_13970 [Candidatus Dojkabacteria bacterium]|jgi:hypothetical protein|nr:hypothetical protein [Candidatus Dojkabacteria bacterium]
MKIILPSQINPPRLRKDGSASMSFDTRELTAEEIFTIMSLRHSEGWLCFAPNENELEIPTEKAEIDEKSSSERLRAVLFVWYKQQVEKGKFVGLFDTFKKEKMETIIEGVKSKLD